ncbi:hypothetical protein QMK19_03195 [Streptomyces sp. H10-C2]|uniref:hypothetical protein n=1 Tax=unclassified Streptomyces TaxID=2593676 RepID=UPI0024BBB2E0|nr:MULTISPECIES: hypothetical protein [unclassified Streptomyces]MDJ0342191.1 hypothetical protein [Streptomyces sp. PH10-H1]MDJ0368705.1 hypothetical protein [Streptomyces sp. H10-C2]
MRILAAVLAVVAAFAVSAACLVGAVAWFGRLLDRAESSASHFERDRPFTEVTKRDSSWLAGDYPVEPFADPTSPTKLCPVPAPRKETP